MFETVYQLSNSNDTRNYSTPDSAKTDPALSVLSLGGPLGYNPPSSSIRDRLLRG
jgi:hypothetical protein